MAVSFKSYVERARVSDTPAGDFIADARLDRLLPAAKTLDELETYLLTPVGNRRDRPRPRRMAELQGIPTKVSD
jgi:hypothetical protein